jgi:hypothetical protein
MVGTACCGVRGSSNQGRPRPQTRDVVFWGIFSITIQAVSGLHTPLTSQLRANHAQRCSREAGRGPERAKRAALRRPGHGPSGRGGAPAKVQVGGRFTPRKTQQTVAQQSGRRSGGREGPKDAFGGVGRAGRGGRARHTASAAATAESAHFFDRDTGLGIHTTRLRRVCGGVLGGRKVEGRRWTG